MNAPNLSIEVIVMNRFSREAGRLFVYLVGVACMLTGGAFAQSKHLSFDSPEAWALKYFTSSTLLSGLQPPEVIDEERRRTGSVTVGLEAGWLPALNPERARVGFSGKKQEDVNKAPVLMRPSVRVGLPWRFSLIAAGPPPVRAFGVTPRLFAFGLERPILERRQWSLGWRAYGQVGSVKSSFTCPQQALAFPAGSPGNPSGCIGESADVASLRYAGTEVQFAHRISKIPRLTLHVAAGINLIDALFQVNAPLETRFDRTRLWTRGKTFSGSAGVSYFLTKRAALTVDTFYTPLWVRRTSGGPRTNDGLFNVRALLSYTLR
jgi:hypothetical protein